MGFHLYDITFYILLFIYFYIFLYLYLSLFCSCAATTAEFVLWGSIKAYFRGKVNRSLWETDQKTNIAINEATLTHSSFLKVRVFFVLYDYNLNICRFKHQVFVV